MKRLISDLVLVWLALAALVAVWFFSGCNPAKKLQKQQDAIDKIVEAANAKRVTGNKDSIVFLPGKEIVKRDTTVIIDTSNNKTIERYYFNNYSFTKDTVKFYERDLLKEQALFSQNERHRAQLDAALNEVGSLKKRELVLSIVIAACLIGGGFLLKSKLF